MATSKKGALYSKLLEIRILVRQAIQVPLLKLFNQTTRNHRLFGAILNYIEATSYLYHYVSTNFNNDGRGLFQYLAMCMVTCRILLLRIGCRGVMFGLGGRHGGEFPPLRSPSARACRSADEGPPAGHAGNIRKFLPLGTTRFHDARFWVGKLRRHRGDVLFAFRTKLDLRSTI